MERIQRNFEPEVAPEFDPSFDRAGLEADAARTARIMVIDCIDPSLTHEHRFEAITALIEELSTDRGNYFIVEALKERLGYERALLDLEVSDEQFSLTV